MVLCDSGDYFATNLRFFISAESLTAFEVIPTRWALPVHVKFSMDDLFDVSLQQIQVIAIGPKSLRRAQREIVSCEHCYPEHSEIPFDWMLAEVTGKRGPHEFILSKPARCPTCKHPITEKTLVDLRDDG